MPTGIRCRSVLPSRGCLGTMLDFLPTGEEAAEPGLAGFIFTRKDKMFQHEAFYRSLLPTAIALPRATVSSRQDGKAGCGRGAPSMGPRLIAIFVAELAFTSRRCRGMVSLQSAQAGSIGLCGALR